MRELAPGLRTLPSRPEYAFNTHVVGGVVVDAGTRGAAGRILGALNGTRVTAHAVTHAHADHQGSSRELCARLGVPFWGPADEADALERGDLSAMAPSNVITRWQLRNWAGPGVPVERGLREGDELDAGFVAIATPGHSPGHLSFWREDDRTLVAGDVLFGRHPLTGRRGLHEPPARFTLDPARNRESIRRVAELRPKVMVFGHGPAWRDPDALRRFADALPAD